MSNDNKVTEKFKRPFKKRHSSVYHQPSNRVNKYLAQAIEARSVDREKSTHVNLFTLCFKDSNKENQYHDDLDVGYSSSLACALVLLVLLGILQATVLPRTIILLLLFLTGFIWISVILMLLLAVRLRWILWDISQSFVLRLAITVFTIVLIYTVAQVNVFTCRSDIRCTVHPSGNISFNQQNPIEDDHRACPLPQYIVLSCALGYLAVAIFLRLPIILKASLLVIMSTIYILLIEFSHIDLFLCYNISSRSLIPPHLTSVVQVLMFVLAVLLHGRQVEWTARLDFLWQIQANEEKREMDALQHSNKRILFNLLPAHVATHFLDNQFRNNMNTLSQELYHQSYSRVGVVFASITNYHEFYTELDGNNQGVECLRLLNEIIADFDDLLSEERFKAIDKIKTVGSTYMAAVGLMPDLRILDDDETTAGIHLSTLVEFVFAMRDRLLNINENSYNNFMLRVGINVGPVVAGVIGARKPQYDIWGNTVNVASRMDSTGLPNHTQVTEEVYQALRAYPYEFQCRGKVKVKGKGDMTTYFLIDRKQPGTLRVEELNSLRSSTTSNATGNMYGGVATPLALLHHGEMNGRPKQQHNTSAIVLQTNRSNSREDNYSGIRNAMRLPPLRENGGHRGLGDNAINGCENEPLLPSSLCNSNIISNSNNKVIVRNCNGKKLDERSPPPPLPPHKTTTITSSSSAASYQRPNLTQDLKYTPPWPRAPNPYAVGIASSSDNNIKPYLKPLPRPPEKDSPIRHQRKHHNNSIFSAPASHLLSNATTANHDEDDDNELLRAAIKIQSTRQQHLQNNPLQTSCNINSNTKQQHRHHSPLHSTSSPRRHNNSPHRHSPLLLQRHYSDESLPGLYNTVNTGSVPQRIHSSADEISSLNHSPSISSSDESYSRTTDADASPCVSPPLVTDTQQYLFPSDIQVNPCSSPEVSPRASLDYIPPNCSLRNNNSNSNNNNNIVNIKRNNLPPNAVLALAAQCNTVDSSIVTSPPILDGEESCRGESCASFEFVSRPNTKITTAATTPAALLRGNNSVIVNGAGAAVAISKLPIKQRSLEKRVILPARNKDNDSTGGNSDSVLECNKLMATNCKRSPSFKEADEIRELLREDDNMTKMSVTSSCYNNSERSLKRDGSCQTDKKDLRRFRMSPSSGFRSSRSGDTNGIVSKVSNFQVDSSSNGPFEREIQKLLDEQNLLQNIPPKIELNQLKNRELALEPLALRYAATAPPLPASNNNHQVGLAAIQALALGLRVNPTAGSVTLQCMSPSPVSRASSTETGSLKRGASPPSGPVELHKQAKVSPLDRTRKQNQELDVDCDMREISRTLDDDTDLESFEREEQLMEEEAAREEEVKKLLEDKVQEKLRNLENAATATGGGGSSSSAPPCQQPDDERVDCNNHSQSEWSDEEEEDDEEGGASEPLLNDRESTGYTTDDPALENISMMNETGLTDAEGALSDVNSAYNDHNHMDGDMDDNTSMSSRASSRIFDSDAMMSLDSLSALYDSEYDNCYRTDDDLNGAPDLDSRLNYFSVPVDDVHLANIRSMSESITRNFGQPRSETDPDSDV